MSVERTQAIVDMTHEISQGTAFLDCLCSEFELTPRASVNFISTEHSHQQPTPHVHTMGATYLADTGRETYPINQSISSRVSSASWVLL